jgi:acetyl esterase
MNRRPCEILGLLVLAVLPLPAAEPDVSLSNARSEVYKTVGDRNLRVHVFAPSGSTTNRPAIVFFFGGGWNTGSPKQFESHCRHFASRGMVALTAEYRVRSRDGVAVVSCVNDAKTCLRWVRGNAVRLGIDPERVVAAGGSAGGHLAAATAMLSDFEEEVEALRATSAMPDALVLFNPALVLAPLPPPPEEDSGDHETAPAEERVGLFRRMMLAAILRRERLGAEPEALSPIHHVTAGLPPTIIFHGTDDRTVPFWTAEAFTAAMRKAGNRCELVGYEGQGHGFFNVGREGGRYYRETLDATDRFLVSLGYLEDP